MANLVSTSNAAADLANIPRLLLLACGCAESGLDPFARRPAAPSDDKAYWPDVSGGVWQQTVRWDPEYHGGAEYPGEAEIERVLALQYVPERSALVAAQNLAPKWRQYQPDILKTLLAYNWPAGGGQAASAGTEATYRAGIAEAQSLLGVSMPVTFDPAYPAVLQDDPSSCAPTSLTWAMRALGRHPADNWIEMDMLALRLFSYADGLEDHTGAGIVTWLQIGDAAHYGSEGYGISNSQCPIAWDALIPEINPHAPYPILLGLPAWDLASEGHWVGIRGFDAARGVILLANPDTGPTFGQSELTRAQFEARAKNDAAIVRVLCPDLIAAPSPPPPPPSPPAPADTIRTQLAAIRAACDQLEAALP